MRSVEVYGFSIQPSGRVGLGVPAKIRIGLSGDEETSDAALIVDLFRHLDAIRTTRESYVHQDEIGSLTCREQHRLGRRIRDTDALEACASELLLAIERRQVLIFDNENSRCRCHDLSRLGRAFVPQCVSTSYRCRRSHA